MGYCMKKLFWFVLFVVLGMQFACSHPRSEVLTGDNSYAKSAKLTRKTVFVEQKREASEYANHIFSDLKPYIENALVENNFIVTGDKTQADFICLVDFASLDGKTITKIIYRPHYSYTHDNPYGYGTYEHWGTGAYAVSGADYYTKKYTVYPHVLRLTCNEQKQGKSALVWETDIIYNSRHDDFRVNIQSLIEPLSKNIAKAKERQTITRYEFDTLD